MSNNKLKQALEEKRQAGESIIVPYIMAGDGGLDVLEDRLTILHEAGAAAVELGIPFSDPVADGPTIQEAGKRALENGTTLSGVLGTLKTIKRSVPIILMTYLNPIYAYGLEKFARDCAEADVNGVIIPDLPIEEEDVITGYLKEYQISSIRLAAMTSPDERLAMIAGRTEGFLYAVSVTGTTGARASHGANVKTYLKKLSGKTNTPVLAGFGVSTSAQARELAADCDGVVIGSTIVNLFYEGKSEEVKKLIRESSLPVRPVTS
ncbi:tryptophan synthase subunit alpha [Virgibacillus kekensis]|uniref:Tryptophan synthase alpha chain n=1 Tax=Virgibacillus kekensis TaxID=202261 RepID=A0ABV9DND7_9BACI